jgi:predicted dehydrogenase
MQSIVKSKITKFNLLLLAAGATLIMTSYQDKPNGTPQTDKKVKLLVLDPGHFHAALMQKSMYSDIDHNVHVYAPDGPEVKAHLSLIDSYNTRADNPTAWKEEVYNGANYFEKLLAQKAGNVVVIAGNNLKKTAYISKSINAGLNVLADKPMAINAAGFTALEQSFATAKKNHVLLYDIMTERYEITNILQKELLQLPDVFGTLKKGTVADPAITKESVHHFFKVVSGKPLVRPMWYYDVEQEGEGIVDVTTHMVDLIQWVCFPGATFSYQKDIQMLSAKRWPTVITPSQFQKSTLATSYPDYLKKYTHDTLLNVYANGEMNYTIRGVHAQILDKWNFEAPAGTGDTHFSQIKGTKANLVIRQEKEQQYQPILYLEPLNIDANYEATLTIQFKNIQQKYPGVELKRAGKGWEVIIPASYKIGHEAQFAEVAKKYLEYLKAGKLPDWEVPNMLTKYYTTTQALIKAHQK